MAKVELYTTQWCGYCARARALLGKKGVDFTIIDVLMDFAEAGGDDRPLGRPLHRAADFHRRRGDRRLGRKALRTLDRAEQARSAFGDRGERPLHRRLRPAPSGPEVEPNIAALSQLPSAAPAGADFIMTPEVSDMIEPDRKLGSQRRGPRQHPHARSRRDLARETGAWLLLGSSWSCGRVMGGSNRSFLIAPDGEVAARYDKIHMFDVALPSGESYRESKPLRRASGRCWRRCPGAGSA